MRIFGSLWVGLALALTAAVVVLLGSALDLELASVALLGAAMGGVIALVPDRTPWMRLGGFALGFLLAWVGYVIRAAKLPDSTGGHALAAAIVVLLCTLAVVASRERIALWVVLLGAGAFAGAYEFTYNQAPQEIASTSVSTATTMLFNVALGFLVATLVLPMQRHGRGSATDAGSLPPRRPHRAEDSADDSAPLDSMLEGQK